MGWIKSNESKGIFLSLLIHSALLSSVLISKKEPIKVADKNKSVSIDLTSYKLEKKVDEPKKLQKPKQKPKPKPKKIVRPKPKPKNIQIPKEEFEKKVEKNVQKQISKEIDKEQKPDELIKPMPTKKVDSVSSQHKAFVKTNFEIIRDMVLSNVKYPSIARKMKWTGVVEMELVVNNLGKLTKYSIIKSSGRKYLDKAALKAVQSIVSKTLPKPKYTTTIILPINFELI